MPMRSDSCSTGHNAAAAQVVFVQTNDPAGNAVLVYDRADDGTLSPAGTYPTGGNGGAQSGAVVDPLASQGSVAYDAASHVLVVTNAGTDTVSVFGVDGDTLTLRQVIASGGAFPTSVAIHNDLVYVLDTGNAANVRGYRLTGGKLHPTEGSTTSLGITGTNPPQFLASPGQVGFSPDGTHFIVTDEVHRHDRRVRRAGKRAAFVADREPACGCGPVRVHLRHDRPARRRRGGHKLGFFV